MNRRRRLWIAATFIMALGAIAVWAVVGDVPFLGWPAATARETCPGYRMPTHGVATLTQSVNLARVGGSADSRAIVSAVRGADRPASDLLWNTQVGSFQGRAAIRDWQGEHAVSLAGFATWQLPINPTWREDPFRNASWRLYYHSLGFLLTMDASGSGKDRREAARYLLDWVAKNDAASWTICSPWDDLAVSLRTDNMVLLLSTGLLSTLTPSQLQSVIQELGLHGQLLAGYLDDPLWRGHNHQMFHALSLYNLATAFPELAHASQWKSQALAAVRALPSQMVDPVEGVSLEQAPSYHYLAIDLFIRAEAYLAKWGDGFPVSTRALLARMLDFAAVITRPDGSLPAIGDTAYRAKAPLDYLQHALDSGIPSEMARFLLTNGAAGVAPAGASFYPRSGYAVFRNSATGSPDDLLHVVFDMGPSRHIHGHDDALNVVVALGDHEVLVDSGGPFAYGDPGRFDFVIAPAHNALLIGDETYRPGDVTVGRTQDTDSFSLAEGWHSKYAGYRVERTVVMLKQLGYVLLIDQAVPVAQGTGARKEHPFDLLYHLPPANVVSPTTAAKQAQASYSEGSLYIVGSGPLTVKVTEGQTSPNLRGWVTPGYAQKVPAPLLTASTRGTDAWFVTLLQPRVGGSDPIPTLLASREPNGSFRIDIVAAGTTWEFLLPTTGEATLATSGT